VGETVAGPTPHGELRGAGPTGPQQATVPAMDAAGAGPAVGAGPAAATAAVVPAVPDQVGVRDLALPRARERTSPSTTGPGSTLSERYRLTTRTGSDPEVGVEFWRARDLVLQREVSITLLRTRAAEEGAVGGEDDPTGLDRAQGMIVRALRSGAFEHAACARLLDILTPDMSGLAADVLGAAVSEWIPGYGLAEVPEHGPLRPIAVANALQPLAAAAEQAHRHGLVLGIDQPQRIRVRPDGIVQLSFALPRVDARPADDVRGLGAVLVALLTARWPLPGADTAGLPAADRTPEGQLVPPSSVRRGVPLELDALALGTLGPATAPGHVRTAAAVNRLLGEVIEEHDREALLPLPSDGLPSDPLDVWQDGPDADGPDDPQRRRKLRLVLCALAAVMVLIGGYAAVELTSMFADPRTPAFVVADPGPEGSSGGRAAVAGVEVYGRNGDNASRVARVIDGDVTTAWRTSTYRQQLPTLKPGVGVMISFGSPVQLSALAVTSPSRGTHLQVRAAPSAEAALAQTTPLGEAVLTQERTTVSLTAGPSAQYVLIWIDRLSGDQGSYVTAINELEFRRSLA